MAMPRTDAGKSESYSEDDGRTWGGHSAVRLVRPTAGLLELVLVDQAVERLAVDARRLGGGGHIAFVAREQITEIGGLEHAHPALLRVLELQSVPDGARGL